MNSTTSQQKSSMVRIRSTQVALDTFCAGSNQLFGYGNGSYTFVLDKAINKIVGRCIRVLLRTYNKVID